jgi:hypothetical protein
MANLKEVIWSNREDIGEITKESYHIDTGYKLIYLHAPYGRKVIYAHDSEHIGTFNDFTDLTLWFKEENAWD